MDLAFTAEERAFQDEVRSFVKANLPADKLAARAAKATGCGRARTVRHNAVAHPSEPLARPDQGQKLARRGGRRRAYPCLSHEPGPAAGARRPP